MWRANYSGDLTQALRFENPVATVAEFCAQVIYHVFSMLVYFTPLLGGIIADTWLGKFWCAHQQFSAHFPLALWASSFAPLPYD